MQKALPKDYVYYFRGVERQAVDDLEDGGAFDIKIL